MTKKIQFITVLLSILCIFSCNNNKKNQSENLTPPQKTVKSAIKLKHINAETKEYLSGKNIVIILGHSYNSEENIKSITQLLDYNYGVETEDKSGLISVFVYPEDFMFAGKIRISSIIDKIESKSLAGIITLGAPEGLCNVIAKIQDKSENGILPYPVFSLLPQDNVLGSEATSDFVLDYVQQTESLNEEQTDFIPNFDVSVLLLSSIQQMINLRGPLVANKDLLSFVQKLVGQKKTVHYYFDNETGLQSINHFIFE